MKMKALGRALTAYLLVDGYNIIHAWDELRELVEKSSLEDARGRLLRIMANYQGSKGYQRGAVIVVFDAHKVEGGVGSVQLHGGVSVVYTAEAETADHYIERTAAVYVKARSTVTVATSDSLEQIIILGKGAFRMSARELYEDVMIEDKDVRKRIDTRRPVKNNQMMEHFDSDVLEWFEEMRRKS